MTKGAEIVRCYVLWGVWVLLLWPHILEAKEYTDPRQMDDMLEEISEESHKSWLLLSDYYSFDGEKEPAPKSGVTVHKDITYIQAVALYVARDYVNAYQAFKFLFLKDMSNPKVNFYLGLCAYELEDYDGAIAAYERVLFIEPNNARARFELGRSYYKLAMYEQAELEFRKVLRLTRDQKLIDAVKKFIVNIDAYRQRHFFSGSLSVGAIVDDNVNNGNNCIIPDLGTSPVNRQTSDYGHLESMNLQYLYDGGDKNGFFWLNAASLYNKGYREEGGYDIFFARGQTGLEYKSKALFMLLPVGYEYLRYGGEAYLDARDISVKLYVPLWESTTLYAFGKLKEETNLIRQNRGFDAQSREATIGVQNLLTPVLKGVSLYLTQKERRKKRGEETSVDSTIQKIKLNYQKKLTDTISFYPQYTYRELRFLEKQAFWFEAEPVERTDRSHHVALTFLFARTEQESLTLNYTYSDVLSTYKLYSYRKNVISMMYNYTFK